MSVDKFGRYSVTGEKASVLNKSYGLPVTSEGDYNVGNKRLRYVKDPQDNNDAVNLKTLKAESSTTVKLTKNGWGFSNKRLTQVADPTDIHDVVTLDFFNKNTVKRKQDDLEFDSKRNKLVPKPFHGGDAVNLDYFNENTPKLNGDEWDFGGKKLRNVGDPTVGLDAVNLRTLVKSVPEAKPEQWLFQFKRLSQIAAPEYDYEAVNRKFFIEHAMIKIVHAFDARNCVIKDLAEPVNLQDAATKKFVKNELADLGYVIYKLLRTGRSGAAISESVWKSKVLETPWKDLFE